MPTLIRRRLASRKTLEVTADTTGRTVRHAMWGQDMRLLA
jgi:hypothetical protein